MSTENKTGVATTAKTLPTLVDLTTDIELAFKQDQLNTLLNQPVPEKWIKQHPTVKNKNKDGQLVPATYLPIDKVEFFLTRIFQEWKVEVLREGVMFQSVYVTVRLHYKNPVTGQWLFHDGVGAVGVQTDAGKPASDLGAIKQAAIMMALPAAKSYAIKDAAEQLGILFGKNLNRKDTVGFAGAYSDESINDAAQQIKNARNNPNA